MEIYLVRHTSTVVDRATCYGQSDVPFDIEAFDAGFSDIKNKLPRNIDVIYSSPLIRCSYLGSELVKTKYPDKKLITDIRIMELNFGYWEMKKWSEINPQELKTWMNNFTNEKVPGGESNLDLHRRVSDFWNIVIERDNDCCIVTHAGVIRSILTIVNQSDLKDAFSLYAIKYGEVIKIQL